MPQPHIWLDTSHAGASLSKHLSRLVRSSSWVNRGTIDLNGPRAVLELMEEHAEDDFPLTRQHVCCGDFRWTHEWGRKRFRGGMGQLPYALGWRVRMLEGNSTSRTTDRKASVGNFAMHNGMLVTVRCGDQHKIQRGDDKMRNRWVSARFFAYRACRKERPFSGIFSQTTLTSTWVDHTISDMQQPIIRCAF
jgi:hypothetical protein